MTTTTYHQCDEINAAAARRWQLRVVQVIFVGAAAIAMLALFDAARPDTTETMLGSGSVRLADQVTYLPAAASGPVGLQFPQTPPNLSGGGGFAADDDQAQQQEQQALQQMQQSEQQAEEQNEQAEQQVEEGMQQAQMDEQQ